MITMMFKWTKWISLGLISLLLLLIIMIATLLFTNPGLKMALWGAEKALPQLKVEQIQGSLFPRFTLKNIRYIDDEQQLEAKVDEATLAVNFQCFLEPKVCVDQLALKGVNVSLLKPFPESPEPEQEKPPVKSISTPFPIMVNQVSLDGFALNILGTEASWQQFSTAFSMQGERLVIAPTKLTGTNITLAPNEETEEATQQATASASTPEKIELPEVWIPLNLNIQGIEVDDFKLDGESPVIVHSLALAGQLRGHDIKVTQLDVDTPEATASLVTDISLQGDYPLTAQLEGEVHLEDLKGQQLSVSASGSVAELGLDAKFSKLLSGELKGQIEPLAPDFPFDIALNQVKANWPLIGKSDFQIALESLQTKGSLKGYTLDLKGDLDGTDIPAMNIDLSGKGTLEQIDLEKLNLKTLGGELSGQVMANWAEPVNWQAALTMQNIQPGLQWQEAEGNISGSLETSGSLTPQGGWIVKLPKLDIDGILREYPLNIEGELFAQDRLGNGDMQFNSEGLTLSHGPNTLSAKGKLEKQWAMEVDVAFPELDKTVPNLFGSMQGDIDIKGDLKAPELTTDLVINNINWQQQASVENISLKGDVIPLPQPQADLTLTARNLAYEDQKVESIDLSLSGEEKSHQLTLDLVSDIVSTSLAISGEFIQKPSMLWQGKLERVDLESQQGKWTLDDATALAVDIDKQSVKLDSHCWLQGSSSLCLEEAIEAGQSGEAKLALKQFDFDQVAMFIPSETKLEGSADANIYAKWAPEAAPQATVNLTLSPGQVTHELTQPVTLGWDSVELKATLVEDKLDSSLLVAVKDNGDLKADISVLNVMGEQRELDGTVSLSTFDLQFLAPLIDEFSNFDAKISTDIAVSGDVMHPKVNGQFLVEKVQLKGDITPIDINDGQVTANFNGHTAELVADIITPDGRLQVTGDADWQDLKDWSTNARVYADELKVNVPPMVQLKVRPDMTINVTPKLAKVDGDIGIPWGRIIVEELPPSATGVSPDLVIINEEGKPVDETEAVPFNLQTNVNVKIGNDVKLSAFGLEGGLQGQLNIAQREGAPYIIGEVNIVEGSYRSFGQDLLIDEGKILMTGPADQPYVSIKAIRNPDNTQDDVVAGVQVTGPATEPNIEIFSEPAMPQANALSYLLRGQDIDGESGGNAMTTTLIGLSLARTGRVVGEIGQAFGVEDLQLDTAGSGDDSQVTVSGYILPGLQVKYGVGIFDSLGEFTVRYRLMKDLYVEVVSGLDSAVDLLYQFEFE